MTDVTAALLTAFPAEAVVRGQSVLFGVPDAARVIDFLRSRNWRVLGVDGFHTDGSGFRPDLDRIADLSEATHGTESAGRVVDAWQDDPTLYVEFTISAD